MESTKNAYVQNVWRLWISVNTCGDILNYYQINNYCLCTFKFLIIFLFQFRLYMEEETCFPSLLKICRRTSKPNFSYTRCIASKRVTSLRCPTLLKFLGQLFGQSPLFHKKYGSYWPRLLGSRWNLPQYDPVFDATNPKVWSKSINSELRVIAPSQQNYLRRC